MMRKEWNEEGTRAMIECCYEAGAGYDPVQAPLHACSCHMLAQCARQ